MEATSEGLEAAANTRQALKRQREDAVTRQLPRQRTIPILKHEVEIPDGFSIESCTQDATKHGECAKVVNGGPL